MAKRIEASVESDENWRRHVRQEKLLDNHLWPKHWEFLIDEYSRLNRILSCRDHSDPPPRPTARTMTSEQIKEMSNLRLPAISGHGSHSGWFARRLPLTTQGDIGYRVRPEWVAKYNRVFLSQRKPVWSFLSQMNWPEDGLN